MTKMDMEIELRNEKELLRIHENNLNSAKTDAEKAKINERISNIKMEIGKLEEAENK